MTDIPKDMDGKTINIHQDGFTVPDESLCAQSLEYPVAYDFDDGIILTQHLPIVFIAGLFAFSIINAVFGLFDGKGSVLSILILMVAYAVIFGFGLFLLFIHVMMWQHHNKMLIIYQDHLACILKFTDKQKTLLSFDNIYHVELGVFSRTWYKVVLYHVSFSDDGQYYKKHKSVIGYVSGLDKQKAQQIITNITYAMQAYHATHQVNLPTINRIRQRA